MKKVLLILAFTACLTGCAYFTERFDAAGKCANDPACLASVQEKAKAAKAVGDASGIPWAGAAAGALTSALILFFARKKKEEKK